MLEGLFIRAADVKRYLAAPLFEERDRYLAQCSETGAARCSLRLIANFQLIAMNYLQLEGAVSPEEIDVAAQRWASRKPLADAKSSRARFRRLSTAWLKFLGRLRTPAPVVHPYAEVILDFSKFMRDERSLAPATVDLRCKHARRFLGDLWNRRISLQNLSIRDIDQIVASRFNENGWSRRTIKMHVDVLRGFLKYGDAQGLCSPGLAAQIIAPRIYNDESLPAGPDWETVKRLFASTETNEPADIRDRAILFLLAVYGLRASEVGRLTLDDLDWEKERVRVRRSKSSERTDVYPVTEDLALAILRYLKEVRPQVHFREIFVKRTAPLRPLTAGAIGRMVSRRLKPMGVRIKHHGAHALRHACACRLLAEGLSMKEIGDHLGHRSVFATATYAKLDLNGLREVANLSLEGLL